MTGNHTLWGCKCTGGRQRKVEKDANLQHPNVICCSLCPYYNKLVMQIRSTQHVRTAWHFQSKLNKDKNPSSLGKLELEWKSGTVTTPQIPPSPFITLPIHLYTSHNWLARETQGSCLPVCPPSSPRAYFSLKSSLYFFNCPLVSEFLMLWDKNLSLPGTFWSLKCPRV